MLVDAHVDSNNSPTEPNYICALSKFGGGELWIAGEGGGEVRKVGGQNVAGRVISLSGPPVLFNPRLTHSTEPWRGSRYVIVAYCVRGLERLQPSQVAAAEALGFVLPQAVAVTGAGPMEEDDRARPDSLSLGVPLDFGPAAVLDFPLRGQGSQNQFSGVGQLSKAKGASSEVGLLAASPVLDFPEEAGSQGQVGR